MNNILSPAQNTPLAERTDLHKSCKSLEALLNILNDYCEAATAIVVRQKRLARALRDTAGLKVTNEIAGNALNASADIFEALADVDSKFAKIADKEYDTTSTEVKKWFKKLSKEEKLHDERIMGANAKIKQASQSLEKKSKKKALDAQEEHARYVQLVSILGPEITQEKYNHALQTTQKHTITTYSVAASLSRIADAEWLRTCESVRRFAPTVGSLGEWRSLCEGRWLKSVPGDLVDLIEKGEDKLKLNTIQERTEPGDEEEGSNQQQPEVEQQQPQQQLQQNLNVAPPSPTTCRSEPSTPEVKNQRKDTREPTPTSSVSTSSYQPSQRNSPDLQRRPRNPDYDYHTSFPVTSDSAEPHNHRTVLPSPQVQLQDEPHSDNEREDDQMLVDPNTGSVRSLSAFPAPPTHFPLPRGISYRSQTGAKLNQEEQTYTSTTRLSESPLPMGVDIRNGVQRNIDKETGSESDAPLLHANHAPERQRTYTTFDHRQYNPSSELIDMGSSASPRALPNSGMPQERNNAAEEFLSREFGVLREDRFDNNKVRSAPRGIGIGKDGNGKGYQFPSASIPVSDQKRSPLERIDTGGSGTGSIVAAMKNRYVNAVIAPTPDSRSPPPRTEVPKLQTSVSQIATKYQSPLASTTSPPSPNANSNTDIRENLDREREQEVVDRQSLRRPSLGPGGGGNRSLPLPITRHLSSPPNPENMQPISRSPVSSSVTSASSPYNHMQREREVEVGSPPENGTGVGSRWRKMEELAEFGIRAKEKELKEREQDIMMRERELAREREKMGLIRDNDGRPDSERGHEGGDYINYQSQQSPGNSPLQPRSRERRISFRFSRQKELQTPTSQQQQETHTHVPLPSQSQGQGRSPPSPSSNPNFRHQSHHSYSSQNLNQDYNTNSTSTTSNSGSGSGSYLNRSTGSSNTPLTPSSPGALSDRPSTSTSNNNNTTINNTTLLLPPQISHQPQQQQEKKGGWIRRLSMPVGQAFSSLDSSKRNSNSHSPLIPSNTRQLGAGIVGGRGLGMDERKNLSSSSLALPSSNISGGGYGYSNQNQVQGRNQNRREYDNVGGHDQNQNQNDGGRFGLGLGLGKRSLDGSRSASNLNLNLGRK